VIPVPALGRRGESRAAWYYRLRGYRIVARNVRMADGELDLIVRRWKTLVFVEVKTRQSLAAGPGHHAVTREKQLRIVRLATQWLLRHPHAGDLRYDVLSLHWNGRRFDVSHFPDAFRPIADPRRPWKWK